MPAPGRIVVIGASAGGVETLRDIARDLPASLDAAVFIVLHIPASVESVLPRLLRQSGLDAAHAIDREALERGRIYVAKPDHHLTLHETMIRSVQGPRVNGYRPAIDPLFRSAALAFGNAVIGVVVSGALDDGAAGLRTITDHGGLAIVQDPDEALYDGMPRSAIEAVGASNVDAIVRGGDIGRTIVDFVARPLRDRTVPPNRSPTEEASLVAMAEVSHATEHAEGRTGAPSEFGCPHCGGVLWETVQARTFACRVGHSFSSRALAHAQARGIDDALWTALRASEETAALCRRLRDGAADRGHEHSLAYFADRVNEAEGRALTLRSLLRANRDPAADGEPYPDATHAHADPIPLQKPRA